MSITFYLFGFCLFHLSLLLRFVAIGAHFVRLLVTLRGRRAAVLGSVVKRLQKIERVVFSHDLVY